MHLQNLCLTDMRLRVKMGIHIVTLPEHAAHEFQNDCSLIPLKDAAEYAIGLYTLHGHMFPALRHFLDVVQSMISEPM